MKNILNERPSEKLSGRLKFSAKFVSNRDIKNKKVLDIGCGYGWFELNVLGRGVNQIAGIEITALDLKTVRDNIREKRAVFKVGGALKLPFEDNYFDTVVAWEVIEHIPKNTEDKMFKEANRVLKQTGVFYLSTPYNSYISKYLDPAWWLLGHRHYSKEKLIGLGKKYNFKISEVYIRGGWWNLISLFNMYIFKWIFKRQPFFDEKIKSKTNKEYDMMQKGFMSLFIKYEKHN